MVSTDRSLTVDSVLTRILHIAEAISAIQFNFIVLLLVLYILGNIQDFSQPSGFLILRVLGFFGFSAVVVNVYSLLVMVVWSLRHHALLSRQLIISLIRLILGFVIALTGPTLHAILLPNGGS
jgi:hypothetical protein